MDTFLQQIVNGLTLGCVYAVVALGYVHRSVEPSTAVSLRADAAEVIAAEVRTLPLIG